MTKSHTKSKTSNSFRTKTTAKKKPKTSSFERFETYSMMHVGP